MKLRISVNNQKIRSGKERLKDLSDTLQLVLQPEEFTQLFNYSFHKAKNIQKQLDITHNLKLSKLIPNLNGQEEIQLKNKKWIQNFSSRNFNESEINVLMKGTKFAITPVETPTLDFICGVEQGLKNVQHENKCLVDIARAKVVDILRKAKPPPSNLSKNEIKAIKQLKSYDDIVIMDADKGNCTVVLNKEEYNRKIMELLKDEKTYNIVDKCPTKSIERRLNAFVWKLFKADKITYSSYKFLHSTDAIVPRFYGLPKTHKINIPLRPIVSFIGSPTYNLSKFLKNILAPLVNKTSFTIKNSTEFVNIVNSSNIYYDDQQVSFDVTNLFTSVPLDMARQIVLERVGNDTTLEDRTQLTTIDVIEALDICLQSSYLQYNKTIYKQTFGTPMGSPLSPIIAYMVMEDIEQKALGSFNNPPSLWLRYVDDVYVIMKTKYVDSFHEHINSISTSIQFTKEVESSGSLAFLDVRVSRGPGDSVLTTVYRKPTHTNRYLPFSSHHPLPQKLTIPQTLFSRADNLIRDNKEKTKEIHNIIKTLKDNGFPRNHCNHHQYLKNNKHTQTAQYQTYTSIPYVRGVSEPIKRILTQVGIGVALKPINTLSTIIRKPKDPVCFDKTSGLVYEIACRDCDAVYIGETGRSIRTRTLEHARAVRNMDIEGSALCKHVVDCDHFIDWDNPKVLKRENHGGKRRLAESYLINKKSQTENVLNRNDGSTLPSVYQVLNLQ